MARSQKGSQFERKFSKDLSLWWTGGKRDDVFWRSTTSGARFTTRQKAGKSTFGQAGDITAVDPIGSPLMDMLTIELKRGYEKDTIQDIIDRKAVGKSGWQKFYEQTVKSYHDSGSFSWALITHRTRRKEMIWLPWMFVSLLRDYGCTLHKAVPQVRIHTYIEGNQVKLFGTELEQFFAYVTPQMIKDLSNEC